jgi:antitoxin component YwqK of YwqJK toxin-antitoxin module
MKFFSKIIQFVVVLTSLTVNFAYAGSNRLDTAFLYYKYSNNYNLFKVDFVKVNTREECDFFRMITSPDSADGRYNVKDFYKNGRIKFVGKASSKLINNSGIIALEGNCTNYLENGIKQSVVHYKDGYKEGDEYLFYPDGKVYALKKNPLMTGYHANPKYWECYKENGEMTCKGGNGTWLDFDSDFKNIIISGPIKNGEQNGDWFGGCLLGADSITYTYHYKTGFLKSAEGHDKSGKSYPFNQDVEPAHYWSGPFQFLRTLQTHLDLPKDSNGIKISADDVFISFIIEKDGHTTHLETLAPVVPELRDAIEKALSKCKDWTPRKNYGIPVRAKMVFSLKYVTTTTTRAFQDEIYFEEKQVNDE